MANDHHQRDASVALPGAVLQKTMETHYRVQSLMRRAWFAKTVYPRLLAIDSNSHRIAQVWVFGSVALNEAGLDSDIDVLVIGDFSDLDFVQRQEFACQALSGLSREEYTYDVDWVLFDTLEASKILLRTGPHLLKDALREAEQVYGKTGQQD